MPETVNGFGFFVLAVAALSGALGMLSSRNVIHAAFWLLEASVAAAGLYYLLGADYVALVQLLVYAGAVAVLTIFTVMITLRRREDAIRPADFSPAALGMAIAFFGLIAYGVYTFAPALATMPERLPSLVDFGRRLFAIDGWVLPFEIASLVLTAALVAAVWWSREDDR